MYESDPSTTPRPSGDRHGHDGAYLINEVLHAAGIRRSDTKTPSLADFR
jgi:hypothetical protein